MAPGNRERVVGLRDDEVGEEAEVLGRPLRLAERLRDRQAGVERLQLGEARILCLDGIRDAAEDARAGTGEHARPWPIDEGAGGGGDGEVDVRLLACGSRGVGLVRHGVEHVEGGSVHAVDEAPVDVVPDARGQSVGNVVSGHVATSFRSRSRRRASAGALPP